MRIGTAVEARNPVPKSAYFSASRASRQPRALSLKVRLPDREFHPRRIVIAQGFPRDAGELQCNAERAQALALADAGQFQQLSAN
jgi:hypothetical protein